MKPGGHSRAFPLVMVRQADEGRPKPAAVIECGACGFRDHITSASVAMPAEAVRKKLQQRGWLIGVRNPADDRCPRCLAKKDPPMLARPPYPSGNPETPMDHPTMLANAPKPPTMRDLAEPPRAMTREDRRLIFVRLNEVYESETTGYAKGWTDKRIAEELDHPVAWIALVRDENFGALRDNEELRNVEEGIAKARKDQETLKAAVEAIVKQQALLASRLEDLIGRAKKLVA